MSEVFACPACGKEYPREKRLIGRAVICVCGRRFLVPPESVQLHSQAVTETPTDGPRHLKASASSVGRASAPAMARPAPVGARWSDAVIPIPPRRAEPLEAEIVALPLEAEIVSLPLAPLVAPSPSPYMPQVMLGAVPQEYSRPAAPAKKKSKKRKRRREESGGGDDSRMSRWIKGAACLLLVLVIRGSIRLGCRQARESLRNENRAAQRESQR